MNTLRKTTDAKPRDESPRRLLSLHELASYLSISYATARELVINGHVPSIRLPNPRSGDGRVMKRLLVDISDANTFIEKHRELGARG